MSIVCFVNIGTDRGGRALQLIHKGIMSFDRFAKFDYLNAKSTDNSTSLFSFINIAPGNTITYLMKYCYAI